MTEQEWLACTDPTPMLAYLQGKTQTSHRKLRLFAVACCRRISHLLIDEQARKALAAAERYAEGRIKDSTVGNWSKRAAKARGDVDTKHGCTSEGLAYHAVFYASMPKQYSGYLHTHITVTEAVATITGQVRESPVWDAATRRESTALSILLRDIAGNPFRNISLQPHWLTSTVVGIARTCYDDQAFDVLPILADALEEAGGDNADILNHCRQPGGMCAAAG